MIDRFDPAIAQMARASWAKMKARFPTAFEGVYETNDRGSDALVSIVVYPRCIRLFFLRGVGLPDPEGRLEGKRSQVRSINLAGPEDLDDPAVLALFEAAEPRTESVWPAAPGAVQIRSVTARQIPRRPTPGTPRR
jgi:hypothetical protein